VEQLIVGVNKMDATMPPWSEERFNEIKDEFVKMLHDIGYKPKKVPFIPYSGYDGDNLNKRTDKAPWYKGWVSELQSRICVLLYAARFTNFCLHISNRRPTSTPRQLSLDIPFLNA
jgi:translation elongation factor EF-1alpha